MFSGSTNQQPTTGLFSNPTAPSQPTPLLGSTQATQQPTTGLFNNPSVPSQQTSLLESTEPTQQPTTGIFNSTSAPPQQQFMQQQSMMPPQQQGSQQSSGFFGHGQNIQQTQPIQYFYEQPQPQPNYEYRISNLEQLVSNLSNQLLQQNQKTINLEEKVKKLNIICGNAMRGLCMQGHGLTYLPAFGIAQRNITCDVCSRLLNNNLQGSYRCAACNFDRCEQCYLSSRII